MSSTSPLLTIDANLRAIKALEASSSLPPLPEEVTLDIAGNANMSPDGVKQLIMGLQSDINTVQQRDPLPVRKPDIWTPLDPKYDRGPATAQFLYGLTGTGRVEQFSSTAVQDWKHRAVSEGLLDLSPAEMQSGQWLPEYRSVAAEMMREQSMREFSGEKPGNLSVNRTMELVEQWLSPRGLWQAALELDLFWDFGSVGREAADWGNKWGEWKDEPWNPAKAVSALSGPIDDLVFPVVNWALMLTGLGQIFTSVRVGAYTARGGVAGAKALAGIRTGPSGLSFASKYVPGMQRAFVASNPLVDRAAFQTQSFSAMMLARRPPGTVTGPISAGVDALRSTRGVAGAHAGMQKWRNLSGVVATKKVNQQLLRAGFVSNVQGLVDDERGHSIASLTGLDESLAAVMSNDAVDWAVDLFIYPPNIFERGAIRAGIAFAGRGVATATNFKVLTDNQRLTVGWHDASRAYLEATDLGDGLTGAARVARFDDAVGRVGVVQAMADEFAGGNVERFGEFMAFVSISTALDLAARTSGGMNLAVEGVMLAAEKGGFLAARKHLLSQIRYYDPEDVETVLAQMSRYGLNLPAGTTDEIFAEGSTRVGKLAENRRRLRRSRMEAPEVTAARNGAVADGDVRLYGYRDEDTGQVIWRSQLDDGSNPFFVDVNPAEFGKTADNVTASPQEWGEKLRRRFETDTGRQALLSEVASVGRYDPEKLARLKEMVTLHNHRRADTLAGLMANLNPQAIQQGVFETLPSIGKWDQFSEAMAEVRHMQSIGELTDAKLAEVITATGRRAAVNPDFAGPGEDRWMAEVYDYLVRMGGDPEEHARMMESVFAPLVREVDPTRLGFTVAKADTATKQEALAWVSMVNTQLSRMDDAKMFMSMNPELLGRVDAELAARGVSGVIPGTGGPSAGQRKAIAEAVAEAMAGPYAGSKSQLKMRRLANWAVMHGVSMKDVKRALDEQARLMGATQIERWGRYGVAEQIGSDAGSAIDMLRAKSKELRSQVNFIAAEVDNIPASLRDHLGNRGYKLVYGVDFLEPEDIMRGVPALEDATKAHIRSSRLQNFFARKPPAEQNILKARIIRSSLQSELQKAKLSGRDIRLGRVVEKDGARSLVFDEASERTLINELYGLLDSRQTMALDTLEAADGFVSTLGARWATSLVPFDLTRLPSAMSTHEFLRAVQSLGYTADEAYAIRAALMRSQALGFKEHGLYAIESKLRSSNNAVDALRLLGRHKGRDDLSWASRATWKGAGLAGFIGGGTLVGISDGEGASPGEFLLGGLAGVAGVHGVGRSRLGRHALQATSGGGFNRLGNSFETGNLASWGYLADNLANLRDRFRFSLSPIFDASRYSEATILAQIGEMPEGLLNLRTNQSPSGVRRAMSRTLRDLNPNLTPHEIEQQVASQWGRNRAEFAHAARNDFEAEVIDDVGRRFSSVGILGFSPVAWMESTFWHLRQAGVQERKAYEVVRDIYTYGVNGRSSAELSMNFVFFPFSFTKKALTHMTKFVNQDLGRLILIQDGLATYQTLSENYDLSNEFRDRLPILNRMSRINLLAYGIGPGRFGGVNAPTIGALRDTPVIGDMYLGPTMEDIAGIFTPNMVKVHGEADASDLWDLTRQMLPAVNDVNQLLGDLYEQGRVIASDSHLTSKAEERRGWEEWRSYQNALLPELKNMGMSWAQAMRNENFAQVVRVKRAEISAAYPQWKHAVGDGIAHGAAIDLEIQERLNFPKGREDEALIAYVNDYNMMSEMLAQAGMTMSNPEDVPPEVFDLMRRRATELAQWDPKFKRLYDRFYRRLFGDISTELI